MSAFLVTGATGRQGGATARALLAQGEAVHALVRNRSAPAALALESAGAVLFEGTFDDLQTLREAAGGVEGVFLNTFLDPKEESAQLRHAHNVLSAARNAGTVTTIVLSTAFFTGYHKDWERQFPGYILFGYYKLKDTLEDAVRQSGVQNYTILRPSWLMHNYVEPYSAIHFPELGDKHELAVSYKPDTRIAHFDPEDVGKFAAAALTRPTVFAGKEIELGFENLTIKDVARALSRASGVEIKVRYRSDEEVQQMMSVVPTQVFHVWANTVDLTIDASGLEQYGIKLTTLEEFLEREKGNLMQALNL